MTYTDYTFEVDGVPFISRIADHSPFFGRLKTIPANDFIQMNIQAVAELIGSPAKMTKDEIIAELNKVNEGATHSWILLGENA